MWIEDRKLDKTAHFIVITRLRAAEDILKWRKMLLLLLLMMMIIIMMMIMR